ncbi:MAG: glycine zipper 2TM domain-containing protein [Porphyrobacter sp.]|nr:glycine zipper 2TM domain-containing protein [Porphyrobacter sp.]
MPTLLKNAVIAAAASGMALWALPAAAVEMRVAPVAAAPIAGEGMESHYRDDDRRWDRRDRRYDRYDNRYGRYDQPRGRSWRGRDGRGYCKKNDGTTGLIVGGAVGALLGREVDGGRDRTLGTVLGAAGGALLGKELTDGYSCR